MDIMQVIVISNVRSFGNNNIVPSGEFAPDAREWGKASRPNHALLVSMSVARCLDHTIALVAVEHLDMLADQ